MMMPQIGDVEPWTPPPGILGEEYAEPQWFILRSISQKEKAAAAKLDCLGVLETWYPAEVGWRVHRNAKRDRVEYEKLIAPGYLFALFDCEPLWHRLFAQTKGILTGVVGVDDRPYAVPQHVLARMQQVPNRIQMLRQEEDMRDKAHRLARQPIVGQQARLTQGPLAGMVVDISRIDRGLAAFIIGGLQGTANLDTLERVDGPQPSG